MGSLEMIAALRSLFGGLACKPILELQDMKLEQQDPARLGKNGHDGLLRSSVTGSKVSDIW